MTNGPNQNFEIPAEMREFAERSVEQARKAMDGFVGAAMRAMDAFEGSAPNAGLSATRDMRQKTLAYAEQNLQAAFDHAQKLVRAKDPSEAIRLQAEFVQSQFNAMQQQMRDLGVAAQASLGAAVNQATSAGSAAAGQGAKAASGQGTSGQGSSGQGSSGQGSTSGSKK